MFAWAALAQGLMRARLVIPADPRADLPTRGREAREQVLPDALFFHAPAKALDDPVLLGCIMPRSLDRSDQRAWELVGLYLIRVRRFYEAIAVFEELYRRLLEYQTANVVRVHKGVQAGRNDPAAGIRSLIHVQCRLPAPRSPQKPNVRPW